jgi:hypothetical protein
MRLIICPGIHDRALTEQFLEALLNEMSEFLTGQPPLVFPTQRYPAYSAPDVLRFIEHQLRAEHPNDFLSVPLIIVSFSAGVAGAIAAAWGWQILGGHIKAFIALDGWGVPLIGSFPIHRVSHDYFTHWSSALLGAGKDSFYVEPPVEHLELWRSPHTASGWQLFDDPSHPPIRTTAASFIASLILRYNNF